MCVIVECNKKIPENVIDKCHEKNKDGIGIAYMYEGAVHFEKGLSLDRLKDLVDGLPTPYVVHFRKATVGNVAHWLDHPFPISVDASLELNGAPEGGVLFHNGTVTEWKTDMKSLIFSKPELLMPGGEWSDSRAMAFITFHKGNGVCNLYTDRNRFLLFTPEHEIQRYGEWKVMPTYVIDGTEKPEKIDDIKFDHDLIFSKNVFEIK